MVEHTKKQSMNFTMKIMIGMVLGISIGILLKIFPEAQPLRDFLVTNIFNVGGQLFISALRMLVVPIVLISLVCGVTHIGSGKELGAIGFKTLGLYIITTMIAITFGIVFASLFKVGVGFNLTATEQILIPKAPSIQKIIANLIPSNPFEAMVEAKMLQLIIFALLFGSAINAVGEKGLVVKQFFDSANEVILKLIIMVMKTAPYGVFLLLASQFSRIGYEGIGDLIGYFGTVVFVLLVHMIVTNTILLNVFARLNPLKFFRKMYPAMLFAFSTSSSNASIPVVLETVEDRLGVKNRVAAFVIPLGATVNMDGTAIMQGIATVFIAHAYNIHLGITGYLTVIFTATLASVGTAGVPSVGLITLAMVLEQVGLPVQGVAMIIGVDRLLDMLRTAVNITGDAAVSCVVAKTEKALDEEIYEAP